MNVYTVLCARNEETRLPRLLASLKNQTMPPSKIVVVNDGSTDKTREVAEMFGAEVVDLLYHAESHAGTPKMAEKFNVGFRAISYRNEDFIMIVGSDDEFYQRDYVERLLQRMQEDPELVVASGQLDDELTDLTAPRGGGRLVKGWFWRSVMRSQYPESWAWEDYVNYKAMSLGFKTRGFPDIRFRRMRKEKRTWRKAFGDGRSLYALGAFWLYALARCVYSFFKSPKLGVAVFCGWFTASFAKVERLDTAEWMNRRQRKMLFRKAVRIILRRLGWKTESVLDASWIRATQT